MSDRYHVEGWVTPGVQVAEHESPTFDGMVTNARAIRQKYPRAVLAFGNIDRCDIDDNGLTDDEEERLVDLAI